MSHILPGLYEKTTIKRIKEFLKQNFYTTIIYELILYKKVISEADTFVWDGSQLQGIVVLRGILFLDIGSLKNWLTSL